MTKENTSHLLEKAKEKTTIYINGFLITKESYGLVFKLEYSPLTVAFEEEFNDKSIEDEKMLMVQKGYDYLKQLLVSYEQDAKYLGYYINK